MTLDERWEFLTQNIESLHESVREAHDRMDRLDAQERTARRAFLTYLRGMNYAMQQYLEALENGGGNGEVKE